MKKRFNPEGDPNKFEFPEGLKFEQALAHCLPHMSDEGKRKLADVFKEMAEILSRDDNAQN